MKLNYIILGIAGLLVGISGVYFAMQDNAVGQANPAFRDRVLPDQAATIAGENVQIRQVGNVVEGKFPWKGEEGITVKYDMGEPTPQERGKGRRNKEVIAESVDFGDGGFKIDVLLNEKPDTNTFCYQIEGAENYDFFYQPPLTQEEIDEGAERPEDIVGSYAVYHKTLKNHRIGGENYATGKVMHIPRPQVWEIDNKASTTQWATLSYNEPNLCVTVDQTYLDNATYPVRVDPTFGYTTLGGSAITIADDLGGGLSRREGQGVNLSEDGTLNAIDVGLKLRTSGSEAVDTFVAINREDSAGAGSHDQVDSVEELNKTYDSITAAFFTFTFSSTALVADDYVLNIVGNGDESVGADVQIVYDSASGRRYSTASTGGSGTYAAQKTDPWVDEESTTVLHSIYATYTATPAESTTYSNSAFGSNDALQGNTAVQ